MRRRAGPGRAPGSALIAVAAWLLALTGGGALFVSFSAQDAYLLAVRRQDAASVIEALLLDLGMIVFTLLALGLSRAGQSAGPATLTPSGNYPPWPPNGTTPTARPAPTSPAPWSFTTDGCLAPCAVSPASPVNAGRNA